MSIKGFADCVSVAPQTGKHIHITKLLTCLVARGILLADSVAMPGIMEREADILRGQRLEILTLLDELKKVE